VTGRRHGLGGRRERHPSRIRDSSRASFSVYWILRRGRLDESTKRLPAQPSLRRHLANVGRLWGIIVIGSFLAFFAELFDLLIDDHVL
jgi:hypothetical protein